MEIEVGGNVNHLQTGAKIELGTASDHVVIYIDPNRPEEAKLTIERTLRFHQYAKEIKSGLIPAKVHPGDPELKTEVPHKAA